MNDTKISGKKIFIAGIAGFVPGHLAQYYLNQGAIVHGVDSFITGDPRTIQILKQYPNFHFYQEDLTSNTDNNAAWQQVQFDWIFSLASPASPIDFERIPLEIMLVNSLGTLKLLELSRKINARFLEASTSEVYGDPLVHPQHESYHGNVNLIGPRAPYDESKRFAETLTMTYNRKYQVDTRIVRIFNTYGPRMRKDDGRVIPNFITQALSNEPITVYGDGSQTRSFCFVDDLVRYIHSIMEYEGPRASMPVNIGTTQEFTVLEIAHKIKELCESKSPIVFKEKGADDPVRRRPNLNELSSRIGPSNIDRAININDGLKATINYFRNMVP